MATAVDFGRNQKAGASFTAGFGRGRCRVMKQEPLNRVQKLAVTGEGKNILVSAGAGTGKTRVLVERFLHFVRDQKALVTEILALTFTDKAANEMKSRILARLRDLGLEIERRELESAYISTIHAFASRILREHPLEACVDPHFRVFEAEEADFIKEQALEETLELHCVRGSEYFELLKVYGEEGICSGLHRVLEVARHEGKYLKDFFEASRAQNENAFDPSSLVSNLKRVNAEDELKGWMRFQKEEAWDWPVIEEFKSWFQHFGRRGRGEEKTQWQEIKRCCEQVLDQQIEIKMRPWAETFEKLALVFEERYESKKEENGFLDFDDLQMKAVRLLKGEGVLSRKIKERYREKFRFILVDEFQDTNYLQLELLECLSSGDNLFLVGDYKQSIYRFRGAEPDLFYQKEQLYKDGGAGVRLSLLENYRTEKRLLEFINRFFEKLWYEDELAYEAMLSNKEGDAVSGAELILVQRREDENLDLSRMREAEAIADRMLELREEGFTFGQMVILFDAMKDIGIYEHALRMKEIPFYVLSGRGFYQQSEIQDMMSYLSFLDNPLADIPLVAALRSPLFQIKDDTLVWLSHHVKTENKTTPFYAAVKHFSDVTSIEEEEKNKIRFFLDVTEELLQVKDHLRLTELLDRVLIKTSYELTVLANPQGLRRYANLKKMVNVAREFENHKPMALSSFLRTVRRLETQEARESEARVEIEESGDVVNLMTIHKAKGLEFPVVFVADLGRMRRSSGSKTILAEPGQGYALQVRNEVNPEREKEKPAIWKQIDQYASQKDKEEQKRRLYVAATRAQRKLILSGVHEEGKLEKEKFREMRSWIDWVMASGLQEVLLHEKNRKIKPKRQKLAMAEKKDLREVFGEFEAKSPQEYIKKKKVLEQVTKEGESILSQISGQTKLSSRVIDLPTSAFVAFEKSPDSYAQVYEIGYANPELEEAEDQAFKERTEEEMGVQEFGTVMHRVLECLDFKNPEKNLKNLLKDCFRDVGSKEPMDEAKKMLEHFIKSSLFKRLKMAREIHKEVPFLINERHGLVHGVIDVLFLDHQGWHILDYKTGLGDLNKIREMKYEIQIDIYAHAVYNILKEIPVSGVLYFLKNQWEYSIALNAGRLKDIACRFQEMQEAVLDYRKGLVSNV